tara:strand:- start:8647 stop:11526 length:2880 start_codon:yes stop_codon:yes gene_type:complete
MTKLASVAGFRWTSGNCHNYHHLKDTERKLKQVGLHWDQFKEKSITLAQFKEGMVENISFLLDLDKDDKISLGKRQHELDQFSEKLNEDLKKKERISLALNRCTNYKDGAKLLELEFARSFFGAPINIKTDLDSVDFKVRVNQRLTERINDDEKNLMRYCSKLVKKYEEIYKRNLFEEAEDLKPYLIPKRKLPHLGKIKSEHFSKNLDTKEDDFIKAVCDRFVRACGLYTLTLESTTKRIVSLWFDEFFGKKKIEYIDNQALKSVCQLVRQKINETAGTGYCLLTGFHGPIVLEHLVEYSQSGLLLTPLGTQYPFGYVNKGVNGSYLLRGTNNETTLDEFTKNTLIKDESIFINQDMLSLLRTTLEKKDPDDSPLNWKPNGYVGRLLLQYLVASTTNDGQPLKEEDYVRFLYALDIYFKTECGLRNKEDFKSTLTKFAELKLDAWSGTTKRQLDILSGVVLPNDVDEAERVKKKKLLKDLAQFFPVSVDRTDDMINEEEEEEEDYTRPAKKIKPAWEQAAWEQAAPQLSNLDNKKRTRDSAGGTTKRQQGGKITTGEVKCIYYYFKDLIPTEIWSEPTDNELKLFKMLLDIYIEDEEDPYEVVNPLLLTLIPYSRYSDVMRFFFTILDLYQLEVDQASLQFDFEYMLYSKFYYPTESEPKQLRDSIYQDLGNRMETEGTEITDRYSAEKSLEYILSKVILILRTFNESFYMDEKGEFIPNIEVVDEDDTTTPAVPSLREVMARPPPRLGLVSHGKTDDDAPMTTAPMATAPMAAARMAAAGAAAAPVDHEDAAAPVDHEDAAAVPMATAGAAAAPMAAAPMATGDDAAASVDDEDDDAAAFVDEDDDAAASVDDRGDGDVPMVTATDDSSGGDAAVSGSDGSSDSAAKRERNRGGKKTRRKHKRNHKKSRRKPRKSVSPGRWLRKAKRYTRNKKLKLRKRNTQNRKTKKRKTTRRKNKN